MMKQTAGQTPRKASIIGPIIGLCLGTLALGGCSYIGLGGPDFDDGVEAYQQRDYAEALANFQPLADEGYPEAENYLGRMYATGNGVVQNITTAVSWYRRAARQGLASAQLNLALAYENGEGVARNALNAHVWYNIASSNGSQQARRRMSSIERSLSTSQISTARGLALRCTSSDYRDCP